MLLSQVQAPCSSQLLPKRIALTWIQTMRESQIDSAPLTHSSDSHSVQRPGVYLVDAWCCQAQEAARFIARVLSSILQVSFVTGAACQSHEQKPIASRSRTRCWYIGTKLNPRAAIAGIPHHSSTTTRDTWQSGLFDRNSWREASSGWAQTVVTGRARLGGIAVGRSPKRHTWGLSKQLRSNIPAFRKERKHGKALILHYESKTVILIRAVQI